MTQLQKITTKAKKIRRPGEAWTDAVKRASKMVPSLSPSKKKSAKKKAPKKKKADYHQTGKRKSIKRDKQIKAKPPGKRRVKSGSGSHTYYERRANRSDKPGSLTGGTNGAAATYRYNVLQRINSNVRLLGEAEKRLAALQQLLKVSPREDKARIRFYIKDQRNYISKLKKDISGFKSLLR
jgi:hypothetical protein